MTSSRISIQQNRGRRSADGFPLVPARRAHNVSNPILPKAERKHLEETKVCNRLDAVNVHSA